MRTAAGIDEGERIFKKERKKRQQHTDESFPRHFDSGAEYHPPPHPPQPAHPPREKNCSCIFIRPLVPVVASHLTGITFTAEDGKYLSCLLVGESGLVPTAPPPFPQQEQRDGGEGKKETCQKKFLICISQGISTVLV